MAGKNRNYTSGFFSDDEIRGYVSRIRYAAMFGRSEPKGRDVRCVSGKVRDRQKMSDVRDEIEGICQEFRDRAARESSYKLYSSDCWEKSVKDKIEKKIRIDVRRVVEGINAENLDDDPDLDRELKLTCMMWLEDLQNTVEYCPNRTFIKPKDIYDSLWKCRDFELKHLWQRSVFLSAFLVMCFTGYGAVLLKMFDLYADLSTHPNNVLPLLNFVEMVVAFIGVILSAMWIMMGKGSKAWYEQYEQSIVAIETNPKYSEKTVVEDMNKDMVMHGSLQSPPNVHDGLYSTDAGRYSVSRINIGIGQVALVIWILLFSAHVVMFLLSSLDLERDANVAALFSCFAGNAGVSAMVSNFTEDSGTVCFPSMIPLWGRICFAAVLIGCVVYMICRGIPGLESTAIPPTRDRDVERQKRRDRRKSRKNIWKEERRPKTLIVLGDRFEDVHEKLLSNADAEKGEDKKEDKRFHLPNASRYIALNCKKSIVCEYDLPRSKGCFVSVPGVSSTGSTAGTGNNPGSSYVGAGSKTADMYAKKFIKKHWMFFNRLAGTNMIIVCDSFFEKKYWSFLTEIVRITGRDIFWLISMHEIRGNTAKKQIDLTRDFIDYVGLTNYEIVRHWGTIGPKQVFKDHVGTNVYEIVTDPGYFFAPRHSKR